MAARGCQGDERMGDVLDSLSQVLDSQLARGSVLAIGAAFLFGVFVGFTPCVYPILPITVSYIGGIAHKRKLSGLFYSLIYVLGMALVYSTIGIIVAAVGGRIGAMWNNGWVLLALANFFILLALWQLKVIRIPIPQFIKGSGSKRGGVLGALSVGAASGLVVGPCTFPGLAAMVALISAGAEGGATGSLLFGAAAMFAYSLGLGSLIVICGTFSGLLSSLPRSGKWLNVVEKVFALLLILAAEFFLISLGQHSKFPSLISLVAAGGP